MATRGVSLSECPIHLFGILMHLTLAGELSSGLNHNGDVVSSRKEISCKHIRDEGCTTGSKNLPRQGHGEVLVLINKNGIVMVYLKKEGGTVSMTMSRLVLEVIACSELYIVTLSTRYILGKNNILADQQSHSDQVLPTEWSLLPLGD